MAQRDADDRVRGTSRGVYSRLLDRAAKAGFAILVAGFVAYAFGWMPAHVPVERLSELWSLPLAGIPAGDRHADRLGLDRPPARRASSRALSASRSCPVARCCACSAIIPIYARRGDSVYAAICIAEIAVLLLAASGILTPAH